MDDEELSSPPSLLPRDQRVDKVIFSWAIQELLPWLGGHVKLGDAKDFFLQLNDRMEWIALFHFSGSDVWVEPKHIEVTSDHRVRVFHYLDFFRSVAKRLPENFTSTLCLDVSDSAVGENQYKYPVFAFQKKLGSNKILVPDIDFLHYQFYFFPNGDEKFADETAFAAKRVAAVFSGSTTGRTISIADVENNSLPRLRAAEFFKDSDIVDFRLPNIVQCKSAEVRSMLQEKVFCQKPRLSWKQQLQNRYVISMDGNGATCSRVVIALLSNSILMKYNSDHLLYYFRGLQEWVHYIPIYDDEDVEKIICLEGRLGEFDGPYGDLLADIAREGRLFALRYLNKNAVELYAATLLRLYGDIFSREAVGSDLTDGEHKSSNLSSKTNNSYIRLDNDSTRVPLWLIAHIKDFGDKTSYFGLIGDLQDGQYIQGFQLVSNFDPTQFRCAIEYRARNANGSWTEWVDDGEFVGTRGRSLDLTGFSVRLKNDHDVDRFEILAAGMFSDGSHVVVASNNDCTPVSGEAKLCGMQVVLRIRQP